MTSSSPSPSPAPPSSLAPRLVLRHVKQLVTVCTDPIKSTQCKRGTEQNQIDIILDGAVVVDAQGNITFVGKDADLDTTSLGVNEAVCTLDCSEYVVLPGLVDGHTHPIWSGDRCMEFVSKLAGKTYMEIHRESGGIQYTVKHTTTASDEELLSSLFQRLDRALCQGTTLMEAKSGYALSCEGECRLMQLLHKARHLHPVELVVTYCGAHSIPPNHTASDTASAIVHQHLPHIMSLKQTGIIQPEFIDVFCEKGVFELAETRALLQAGKQAGLAINFHGDELSPIGAAELGAELGATAISHLEHVSEAGMAAMSASSTIATLLPTTAYVLRLIPPPARALISHNVPIALGSDFNPNAHCLSLPLTMNLACVNMRMTMNEALVAATINAAVSINRGHTHGTISQGKRGDLLLLHSRQWEDVIYQLCDPPIIMVIKHGQIVWSKKDKQHHKQTTTTTAQAKTASV